MTQTNSAEKENNNESSAFDDGVIKIDDSYSGEITLVGTVHVSKRTRERVIDTISNINPDVVAIELDSERLYSMFERGADIAHGDVPNQNKFGLRSVIKKQQESMFKNNDELLQSGEADMLPAADMAMNIGSDIALIDMSVDDLKSNIKNNAITDGKIDLELFNQTSDDILQSLKSFVSSRIEIADKVKENGGITGYVEHMEDAPLSEIDGKFEPLKNIAPEIIDALIDERDKYMAGHLHWLRQEGLQVVAVMGRGHLPGVQEYLDNVDRIPEEYIVEPDWYNYSSISID